MELVPKNAVTVLLLLLLLGTVGIEYVLYTNTEKQNEIFKRELSKLRNQQVITEARFTGSLSSLDANLAETKSEQETLRSNLTTEIQQKASVLEAQLGEVSGSVHTLEKLTNTDEELLQKYSKIYFLNEHYIPVQLSRIDPQFVYQLKKPRDLQIHTSVQPYLERLLNAANSNSVDILVTSAYRSFGIQEDLKAQYVVMYGAGTANQFSADQGYSEHQLGTTVDFTTQQTGTAWNKFEQTAAFTWLTKNAHMYGFTLSYSKNNVYYEYEPWHWRFVGKELATYLYNEKKYFYDLDQRKIDTYLVSIFD
jgi:zinc D-Ala-D-Ala carboxypeptidase